MLNNPTILVTGSNGFIGKNLCAALRNEGYDHILSYDIETPKQHLALFLKECDFIFHTAGVNRPEDPKQYMIGNHDFTYQMLQTLKQSQECCPIVCCSSTQASLDTSYGISKRLMEQELWNYQKETGAPVYMYRLPGVFGKWCKPNYNSVVATFCHHIACGEPIRMDDPNQALSLVYIDDVIAQFLAHLRHSTALPVEEFCSIESIYQITLSDLAEKLYEFRGSGAGEIPLLLNPLDRHLYSTFTSYLPYSQRTHLLDEKYDHRGLFCECFKTDGFGQVSISVSKPGVTRGGHWHQSKTEKFCVVQGHACIRMRSILQQTVQEYIVSGARLEMVDIPPGYVHDIKNIGDMEMILLIWSHEIFDPDVPDTYPAEVSGGA